MEQIYNSDKPIIRENQDRFNRYKFSKRIVIIVDSIFQKTLLQSDLPKYLKDKLRIMLN